MASILIFGGTRFFGIRLVQKLLEQGDQVTIATRGLTPDPFGDKVKRITCDREDPASLRQALQREHFNVLFDNICYTAKSSQALVPLLPSLCDRYIVTSSSAVYAPGLDLTEALFSPETYPISYGTRSTLSYAEGKREVEAFTFQHVTIPSLLVRFPVVFGEGDYTMRMAFYVDHIHQKKPFQQNHRERCMSFISATTASQFLAWAARSNMVGPVNASNREATSLVDLIHLMELLCHENALLSDQASPAPFNNIENCTLNTGKAESNGFHFTDLKSEMSSYISNLLGNS